MAMRAEVTIEGVRPYSPSRPFRSSKEANETHEQFDERCWREHAHADENGECFIPAAAVQNGLIATAKYLGEKIAGKGNKQYGAKFERGVVVEDDAPLFTKKGARMKVEDYSEEQIYAHSDGKRDGQAGRVWRRFPLYPPGWKATFVVLVVDRDLTKGKVEEYLGQMGLINGLGRFRPQKGGQHGRFKVTEVAWEK